jgi:hypothetical protein
VSNGERRKTGVVKILTFFIRVDQPISPNALARMAVNAEILVFWIPDTVVCTMSIIARSILFCARRGAPFPNG